MPYHPFATAPVGYGLPPAVTQPIRPEPTRLESLLSLIDAPRAGVHHILTGHEGSFAQDAVNKMGGWGAFPGTALDVLTDPISYVTFGTGGGVKLALKEGALATLSRRGMLGLKEAAEANATRLAATAAARPTGMAARVGEEALGQIAERQARRGLAVRIAGGEAGLVDQGGIKVGLPFAEGASIVPGPKVSEILGRAKDAIMGTRAAQKVAAAAEPVLTPARKALENVQRLFSRRVTAPEARLADAEDAARYGGAAWEKYAKERVAPEVARIAKETGEDPIALRERLMDALEVPRETKTRTAETEVAGVDPQRLAAERRLAQIRGLMGKAERGEAPFRAPIAGPTRTVPEGRSNPAHAALLRRIEVAQAQVKALPVAAREGIEARLAKIRERATTPFALPSKPVIPLDEIRVGSSLVYSPKVSGSTRSWKVPVEVLDRFDNGQVRVRVIREAEGGVNLPGRLAHLSPGSEHVLPGEDLVVPDATRAARARAAERNALPKQLRRAADAMEQTYRDSAYATHARKTGNDLVTFDQATARQAGPAIYREWLTARSKAVGDMDAALETEGSYLRRVNAAEKAEALGRGEAAEAVATGKFTPGPTMKYPEWKSTPASRALESVRKALAKHEERFSGRVAGLEKQAATIPHRLPLEEQTTLGRLVEREEKLMRKLGVQGTTAPGPQPRALPPHPTLVERRLKVEPVLGPAGDRIAQLSPGLQPLAREIQAKQAKMLAEEQAGLASPVAALRGEQTEYMTHTTTQEAREAMKRAGTLEAHQGGAKALSEANASQKARKFVEVTKIDERRYAEAVGNKATFDLTEAEKARLSAAGIISERPLTAREVNLKAMGGELEILGAQWKGGKLVRPGEKVARFFTEDPALALGTQGARHEKSMAMASAVRDFAKTPERYGGLKVPADQPLPQGFARVSVPGLEHVAYPVESARRMGGLVQKFSSPEEVGQFRRALRKIVGVWKTLELSTPGYHLRNQASDMFAMNAAGMPWSRMPRRQAQGWHIVSGHAGTLDTAAGKLSYDRVRQLGARYGLDGGFTSHEFEQSLEDALKPTRGVLSPTGQNKILRAVRPQIENLERSRRYALFSERIAKGETPDLAAKAVKRWLFDYGDLTAFERETMKDVLPFYTWTRKAIPVFLGDIARNPRRLTIPMAAARGVEAAVGGEQPDPRYVPDWIRKNLNVRVRGQGAQAQYFLFGNWVPWGQPLRLLTSPVEQVLQMVTPLVKIPTEIATGKEFATGRDISDFPGQPGSVFGIPIPPALGGRQTERQLRSLAVLAMIDKLIPNQPHRAVNDRGLSMRIFDAAFGKLTQPVDFEKGRQHYLFDLSKRIGSMRGAYDKAIAGDYEGEASQIAPGLERLLREREQLGKPTRAGRPLGERPSETLERAAGLGK